MESYQVVTHNTEVACLYSGTCGYLRVQYQLPGDKTSLLLYRNGCLHSGTCGPPWNTIAVLQRHPSDVAVYTVIYLQKQWPLLLCLLFSKVMHKIKKILNILN